MPDCQTDEEEGCANSLPFCIRARLQRPAYRWQSGTLCLPDPYKAACKASVNSSRVSTIGFAFILLALAAFSTSTAISPSVTP